MSRSGYTDDCDDNLAHGRWRGAVKKATEGKRGQALLRELLAVLDAMPEKKLYANSFKDQSGGFCTLGVLGEKRGVKMDDLVEEADWGGPECDAELVGERFGIAHALAAEIMYMNDEGVMDFDDDRPEERWKRMRKWVAYQINKG